MKTEPKIKALLQQIESGKLEKDKARILSFIKGRKNTRIVDIKSHLNISHQSCTARISDLLDLGVIESTELSRSGKYSLFNYQRDKERQLENAFNRNKNAFNTWMKRGIKKFGHLMSDELILTLEIQMNK